MQQAAEKKECELLGKNKYFYISIAFTLVVSVFVYIVIKLITGKTYFNLGLASLIIIVIALNKLKENIDEKDPTSSLGKLKVEISNQKDRIEELQGLIENKQANINSLVSQIKNTNTIEFEKVKSGILEWYIRADNECYYTNKKDNKLQEASKRAEEDLQKFITDE